jgi:hypothetical protein
MLGPFVVRIRWRLVAAPTWELETEHGSFATPEGAALYANGVGARGLAGLRLASGQVRFNSADGLEGAASVAGAWRLAARPAHPLAVFSDGDFAPVEVDQLVAANSRAGEDNLFEALRYCVFGADGAVDVKVTLDENGDVEVTVFEEPEPDAQVGLVLLPA